MVYLGKNKVWNNCCGSGGKIQGELGLQKSIKILTIPLLKLQKKLIIILITFF